jgi:hypothetical protein
MALVTSLSYTEIKLNTQKKPYYSEDMKEKVFLLWPSRLRSHIVWNLYINLLEEYTASLFRVYEEECSILLDMLASIYQTTQRHNQ